MRHTCLPKLILKLSPQSKEWIKTMKYTNWIAVLPVNCNLWATLGNIGKYWILIIGNIGSHFSYFFNLPIDCNLRVALLCTKRAHLGTATPKLTHLQRCTFGKNLKNQQQKKVSKRSIATPTLEAQLTQRCSIGKNLTRDL